MKTISNEGAKEVETFIKKPMQSLGKTLHDTDPKAFESVQPMIELILKKAGEITTMWKKTEE
jgi:hypothetical protein